MGQMNVKEDCYGIFHANCLICNSYMRFSINRDIEINCESRGSVHIENMLLLVQKCNNPLCEWSCVEE